MNETCPVCGVILPNPSHKTIPFGDINILTCDEVPKGEIRAFPTNSHLGDVQLVASQRTNEARRYNAYLFSEGQLVAAAISILIYRWFSIWVMIGYLIFSFIAWVINMILASRIESFER